MHLRYSLSEVGTERRTVIALDGMKGEKSLSLCPFEKVDSIPGV